MACSSIQSAHGMRNFAIHISQAAVTHPRYEKNHEFLIEYGLTVIYHLTKMSVSLLQQ